MSEDFSPYNGPFWTNLNSPAHRGLMAKMAEALDAELKPQSVLDVGAGLGTLDLRFAADHRVVTLVESTHAKPYVETIEPELAPHYIWTDLDETDASWPVSKEYDLAISIEVAEHLPKPVGERLVAYLAGASDTVWFSAAFPGQHGDGHINERPWSYWEALFGAVGFFVDAEATAALRAIYEPFIGGEWWYRRCALFRKAFR